MTRAVRDETLQTAAAPSRGGRARLLPRAALAGLAAGLVAVAFRACLDVAGRWLEALVLWAHGCGGSGFALTVLVGGAGGWLAVWLAQRFAPEIAGSGIPALEAVIRGLRPMIRRRVLPLKFLGGALSIGSGMALGREGPTVQMGGACGQWVGRWTRASEAERRDLVAAGAGAGLAAAFNAPLAGVLFVLEELDKKFSAGLLAAAFLAAAIADVVARFFLGQSPLFQIAGLRAPTLSSLPWFLALGLVCGLVGVLFNRAVIKALDFFGPLAKRGWGLSGLVAGLASGAAIWFVPGAAASGALLLDGAWAGRFSFGVLAGLVALRFAMTVSAYGSGAPGGIFAPMLVLGALIGSALACAGQAIDPTMGASAAVLGVAGMAAFYASVVRGPLTATVLIMEMTGGQQILLQLLVAVFVSYAVAEALREKPIYEALLERDLARAARK